MTKKELAASYHEKGYNCAQSTAMAFKEVVDVDEKTLFAATEGFGFGMGKAHGTCGAFSGLAIIISLLNSSRDPNNLTKADTYQKIGTLSEDFIKRVGEFECEKIKANGITTCPECIDIAVELLEDFLAKRS